MATVRESFFPTVKCSMCNADVEISKMGDHLCIAESEEPKYSIFPFPKKKSAKDAQAQKFASLPKIDSAAANRPFQRQEQVTPSSSTTGSGDPPTPRDGQPMRSPIYHGPVSPHPQNRDLRAGSLASINYSLDEALPSSKFPRGSSAKVDELYSNHAPLSPITAGGRSVTSRMNNIAPGPFGVSHNNNSRDQLHEITPIVPASSMGQDQYRAGGANIPVIYPPKNGERGQRRDQVGRSSSREYLVAHREARGREEEKAQEVPRRTQATGSSHPSRERQSRSSRQLSKERSTIAMPPPSAFGQRGGKIRIEGPSTQTRYPEPVLNNPKIEVLQPEARSPNISHGRSPSGRLPPHPGVGLPRSPSVTVRHKKNNSSMNTAKVLPTPPLASIADIPTDDVQISALRKKSSRDSDKLGEDMLKVALPGRGVPSPHSAVPPTETHLPLGRLSPPNPGEYSDLSVRNPYEVGKPGERYARTASPSMSSNASSIFSHRSERSSASAMSSPQTPDLSSSSRLSDSKYHRETEQSLNTTIKTNSSGFNDIDGLMKELQSSIHDLAPVQNKFEEQPLPVSSDYVKWPSYDNRQGLEPPIPAPLRPTSHSAPVPVEQPLHPPPGVYRQPPPPRTSPPSQPQPLQFKEEKQIPQRKPSVPLGSPVEELFLPTPPQQQQQQQKERSARRATTSKGNCRGCGEGIVGRSISSADGRLTGRYHKPCFVCQDCHKPFESAEFYVHNNLPYCERHYHKLNQSLCPTCDRGIEGPCLETEWHERYHPVCFSCSECACALDGDYFELNGRPFCERHAFRIAQGNRLGPNRMANMERRRTRLMFM